jgi:hypothetical protein
MRGNEIRRLRPDGTAIVSRAGRLPDGGHVAVITDVTALHQAVLAALDAAGARGLTDRELEQLPQFAHYGPSTIRKRRSELYQGGILTHRGTRDGLMVWVRLSGATHP